VQQGKWNASRVESFLTEAQKHRRVLPDRVKHYRALEFASDLAKDMNAFCFECAEVGEPKRISLRYCSGISELWKRGEPVTSLDGGIDETVPNVQRLQSWRGRLGAHHSQCVGILCCTHDCVYA